MQFYDLATSKCMKSLARECDGSYIVASGTGLNHKNPFYPIATCYYIHCQYLYALSYIIIKQASALLKLIAEQSQFNAIASNVYSYTSNYGEVYGCLVANYTHNRG